MVRRTVVVVALLAVFAAAAAAAEARIVFYGSTGLSLDGLKGYLGEKDREDRIVVESDEAPVYLVFLWDSPSLDPWVTVTDARGKTVGEYSLARGNRLTLASAGRFVLKLTARTGAGHWFCVLLGGREWDVVP